MIVSTPLIARQCSPRKPLGSGLGRYGSLWLAGLWLGLASVGAAPLRVLVLTGANNHDWQATTPLLKAMLEESGRFQVDVTEAPEACDGAQLAAYDVLVSNWSAWPAVTGRQWGAQAEEAILDFVRGGKGFALFHAASATFHDWPEYQAMIGATWALDRTGHGAIHPLQVRWTELRHPVTAGLDEFWLTDELWHRMGRSGDARVLATAYSDPDRGGSGAHEPVVLVSELGRGRCFHLVLGHDTHTLRNRGWQTLMRRGVEWAATGEVTVPPPRSEWPASLGHAILPDLQAATPQIISDGQRLALTSAGLTWLDYRHGGVPFKPYVRHLLSPEGQDVVRDAPFDHLHHHGLMYAIAVNGTNFWEETATGGFQLHREVAQLHHGSAGDGTWAGFTTRLDWASKTNAAPYLQEQRTLIMKPGQGDRPSVLTWQTCFQLPPGVREPAVLSGSHYHGLGMRFPAGMDAQGPFLNPTGDAGVVFRGEERLVDAPWCAYQATWESRPLTVAMFAHPNNRRFPATFFTMPRGFAYLSATLRWHEKPLTVEPGTLHRECYGVAVWNALADPSRIEEAYQSWLKSGAVAAALKLQGFAAR
jgi:type 1 glutamine amidotransferase